MTELSPTLLIVDDEQPTRDGLRRAFEDSFDVYVASDFDSAVAVLEGEKIDVVLTDLKLGGKTGMEVLEICQRLSPQPLCFMMTAYGSVDTAIEAMRRGAVDYVTKPVNLDKLEMLLLRALKGSRLEDENRHLKSRLDKKTGLERLIGNAPEMSSVFETIRQVADSRATVLVQGESGTGKELVAEAIHRLSPRRDKPFVAVHCAALTQELLSSELFGHEKGAFTGAQERRVGRFEQAHGGTLFLDEIGEIDEATQVKLLRVLGERYIERVGGNKRIDVDVRLVAATNKDLEELVKEGTFREDLFYRIHVVRIDLPPLRRRRSDIPLMIGAFLKEFSAENGKVGLEFSPDALDRLLQYDWPGNVRELRTAVEHGVVLARGGTIEVKDLPRQMAGGSDMKADDQVDSLNLQTLEKQAIQKALNRCDGNRTDAATLLGISRRTLHRKLNEYSLG
ncbi:MAG: sigma-54-dependent transcriptional regulator [Candidatus Methylacidiphilales bacterium]